jgi:hypothetical protein
MANTSRTSAGINDKGGKNVNPVYKAINTLTSYVGNVAREIRDIPTAIGAPKEMPTSGRKTQTFQNEDGTKTSITNRVTTSNKASGIKAQIKEAGAAITSGQKGTSVGHRAASGTIKPRVGRGGSRYN